MKKVFIRTFGCQMNEYDSDKMSDVMHAAEGYEPTDNPDDADLILFNTCSVREKAQEKVFSDLGRVKHLKARGALIEHSGRTRCNRSRNLNQHPLGNGQPVMRMPRPCVDDPSRDLRPVVEKAHFRAA